MSSFLTARQHILGYLVPYHGVVDVHKKGYKQGCLATIKMNNEYIVKSKRDNNDNKNMTMKDNSVRL